MYLKNVDVVKTKDCDDVTLAQVLMDAILASSTGFVTLSIDEAGTGFIVNIPHTELEGVN